MKIVFMGTPDFAVPVLRSLKEAKYDIVAVVTQPDRPVGRKKVLTPPPVKVEANAHGINVLQPEKIKESVEIEKVLAFQPDLIVTAAFGQILPKEILDYPKYGCINVHASLLPKYRGGAPIHQAIIDGEKEAGVTIMYMVEKLDAGDMLSYVKVPIEERDTVGSLHDKLSQEGARLLLSTIPNILNGKAKAIPQDESQVTFASNITREMERINWGKTGEEIYNHIRGLHPWPVAFTELLGKVLKVWWGEKVPAVGHNEPGVIERIDDDGFVVSTGNSTSIKITDLQPAGKKRMDGASFIRGAGSSLNVGMRIDHE